jgi:hypothetical protein
MVLHATVLYNRRHTEKLSMMASPLYRSRIKEICSYVFKGHVSVAERAKLSTGPTKFCEHRR